MDLDIKKEWGIDLKDAIKIDKRNPYDRGKNYIINSQYFLKSKNRLLMGQLQKEFDVLRKLKAKGIPVICPYDEHIAQDKGLIYSIYPLINGRHQLNYTDDSEGVLIGKLIAKISSADLVAGSEGFKDSIYRVKDAVARFQPKNAESIKRAIRLVEDYLAPVSEYFPKRFSHGDLHPENLFLGEDIKVMDFELALYREEGYDIAFLIGCSLIEDPINLRGRWINGLINTFVNETKAAKLSVFLLPEMVIATRLKWALSWILLKDQEMIEREDKLLELIMDNIENIRKGWLGYASTDFKYSPNKWVIQDAGIVDELNKAKKRLIGIDSKEISWLDSFSNKEELATDLRLLGIDYGMKDNIYGVIQNALRLKYVSQKNPDNPHVLTEYIIAKGNSCLDFSKFRMIEAIRYTMDEIKTIMDKNPSIEWLGIGYAYSIRNASIAYSEIGRFGEAAELVESLIDFSSKTGDAEVKGELARALSNILTTIVSADKDNPDKKRYLGILEGLFQKYPDSRKIKGAYLVAKANLSKAHLQ